MQIVHFSPANEVMIIHKATSNIWCGCISGYSSNKIINAYFAIK